MGSSPLLKGAVVSVALLLCGAAGAEGMVGIYAAAREADPVLRGAAFQHQAAREVRELARSGYRPAVTLRYDRSRSRQEILESENTLFETGTSTFNTEVVELSLRQPLFRYQNWIRIQQADAEAKQADVEYEKARQDLLLRVAEAYLTALAAVDHLDYLRAEKEAVEEQYALARGRVEAEVGRVADLLEAEARLATVNADLASAEVTRRDAFAAIAEMTGEPPAGLERLRKDFPLTPPDPARAEHWVEAAFANNLDLLIQEQAVDVARQEVRRQHAGHYPTVDLELRNLRKDEGGTVFGGGSEVDTRELMLRLEVPLYLGGAVSARKRQAAYAYQGELEGLVQVKRRVRRDAERAFNEIVNVLERLRALDKAVAAQERVLEQKRAGYRAALYTNLSVLDAERDLYAAKRDRDRARYEYLVNGLRLRSVVGALEEADLANVDRWLVN
jgi:outer membrane protein